MLRMLATPKLAVPAGMYLFWLAAVVAGQDDTRHHDWSEFVDRTGPNVTDWDWTDGVGGTVNPLVVGSSPTRGAEILPIAVGFNEG